VPVLNIESSDAYPPYGSVQPPGGSRSHLADPSGWDGDSQESGVQRLAMNNSAQAGAGQVYNCIPAQSDNCQYTIVDSSHKDFPYNYTPRETGVQSDQYVRRLFAQNYGTWEWNGDRYTRTDSVMWTIPQNRCNGSGLPPRPDENPPFLPGEPDYCAILPRVDSDYNDANGNSIRANNIGNGVVQIVDNGFVDLEFNTLLDSQQSPLVMYRVDWGDGESIKVSGADMKDRSNPDHPHSLHHLFDYWHLKDKDNRNELTNGSCTANCSSWGALGVSYSGPCCRIKPRIRIKDNWGWCNDGVSGNPCPTLSDSSYVEYQGWIVVRQD